MTARYKKIAAANQKALMRPLGAAAKPPSGGAPQGGAARSPSGGISSFCFSSSSLG
jgi:hypothetical protein